MVDDGHVIAGGDGNLGFGSVVQLSFALRSSFFLYFIYHVKSIPFSQSFFAGDTCMHCIVHDINTYIMEM